MTFQLTPGGQYHFDSGSREMFAHYLAPTLQMHSFFLAILELFSGTAPMEVTRVQLSGHYYILNLQWAVLLILCCHYELEILPEKWVVFISVQSCNTRLSLARAALIQSIPYRDGFCALRVCTT